ncbi:unnamed protein product (macronuclear) [Paramecium tetraurelia]|uniref:Peptidase S11 D-alanyl-D-alanine carboxypeptidase A N-terminal domain-containing protein n=1 Tax=Paramecium tetraurelia TaxID=5888 RepID=A0E354_PARTE|nr:uncharacterized protein GSPATT00022894001 [Paramecium tetraurelia]CAK89721.1 unnamed protein product [Paramecium tetraurelia]|eukprot:XP_001457118.1 hypothetical protein (macronuclear) [Paramecium tetraurelia strain d4-2]
MKVKNYSIFSKSKQQQYRICEIIPTICGVNGITYIPDEKPILMQISQCTCSNKKINISNSTKWSQKDRIRSYSQVIQRPITRKSTRMLTQVKENTPPKFLTLRVSARRWCAFQNNSKFYGVNENIKCEVGCLTKLMAIYTILQLCQDYKIRLQVPYYAESVPEPKADLNSYNYFTLEQLLYALILRGGNDALWSIVSGLSEKLYGITQRNLIKNKFLDLYNRNAQQLKMNNTRYTNLEGLADPNNVTTANDLCLLCDQLLKFDIFKRILKTKSYTCRATFENGDLSTVYTWKNRQFQFMKKSFYGFQGINNNSGPCALLLPEADTNQMFVILLKCNPKQEIVDAQMITKYQ